MEDTEDWQIRVKNLEQSLESAEARAQQASTRAAALRDQLELAQHDKRSLAAQHERSAAVERKLQLELADSASAHDADRRKLRDTEAKLAASEAESRLAGLRVSSLETTLSSTEAELKWYGGEVERLSTVSRTRAREFATKTADLEAKLEESEATVDALKRQVSAAQTSFKASQQQLGRSQHTARTLQQQLDEADASVVYNNSGNGTNSRFEKGIAALQAQLEASRIQESTLNDRYTEISRAYFEACDKVTDQSSLLRDAQSENSHLQKAISDYKKDAAESRQSAARLARQVQHLLINAQLSADAQPLLSDIEKKELAKALDSPTSNSTAMQVISERLAYFVDITELVSQNEQQLRVLDRLTSKCEAYEAQETIESDTVKEAKDTIQRLATLVQDLQKERDVLRSQINLPQESSSSDVQLFEDRIQLLQTDLDFAKATAHNLQIQLSDVQKSASNATQKTLVLNQDLFDTREIAERLRTENSRLQSQNKLLQDQSSSHHHELMSIMAQRDVLNADFSALRDQLTEKDKALNTSQVRLLDQIDALRTQLTSSRHELNESEAQVKLLASQRELARRTNDDLKTEVMQLKLTQENLQLRNSHLQKEIDSGAERLRLRTLSFTTADSEKAHKLEDELAQANAQIQDLRALASETQKQCDAKQMELTSTKSELQTKISLIQQAVDRLEKENEVLKNTPPDTTDLDAANKRLEESIAELSKVRAESDASVTAAESRANAAKAEHEIVVSKLQDTVNSLQTRVATLQTQIEPLLAENEMIKSRIESISKERDSLDTLVAQLRAENSELSSSNELLLEQLQATVKVEGDLQNTGDIDMDSSISEDHTRMVELLKRSKQASDINLQVAEGRIRQLESQISSLQQSYSRTQAELAETQQTTSASPDVVTGLEKANATLLQEIKDASSRVDELSKELTIARDSIKPLEAELRTTQASCASLEQELTLIRNDRDQWKNRTTQGADIQLIALQEQLTAKENEYERLRQESLTKLKQEANEKRQALTEASQLNAKVQELTKSSANEVQLREAINEKQVRITHLENEVNRMSDEVVDQEAIKRKLDDQEREYRGKIKELEGALAASTQTSSPATDDKVKELEEKLAAANAGASAIEVFKSEDLLGEEPEELKQLIKEISSKAGETEVSKLKDLIASCTKDRIKGKTVALVQERMKAFNEEKEKLAKERDDLSQQLENAKANAANFDANAQKKFDLKSKIMQNKLDVLTKANDELKLTIRKLKGGQDVSITTLPDGTTKAVPAAATQPQKQQPPQQQQQHSQQQQRRPAVQRNGTKNSNNKRGNNDDQGITKRLREN